MLRLALVEKDEAEAIYSRGSRRHLADVSDRFTRAPRDMTRWRYADGVRNSLFRGTVRRSPGFHLSGDLSTDDADLAEKPVACSVQPVKVLFGGHGFGAIQPHYRREGESQSRSRHIAAVEPC